MSIVAIKKMRIIACGGWVAQGNSLLEVGFLNQQQQYASFSQISSFSSQVLIIGRGCKFNLISSSLKRNMAPQKMPLASQNN